MDVNSHASRVTSGDYSHAIYSSLSLTCGARSGDMQYGSIPASGSGGGSQLGRLSMTPRSEYASNCADSVYMRRVSSVLPPPPAGEVPF